VTVSVCSGAVLTSREGDWARDFIDEALVLDGWAERLPRRSRSDGAFRLAGVPRPQHIVFITGIAVCRSVGL